ncbi:DUF61 family protein [Methanopyrus sp. KOL6]|uniref:DUF61 family protein n=1 Tax=Methanopyrus sp. KOL6 TaxID=1937004 RepID=UPI000B4C0376|nr:DUF61 family protein [Methanopyrus sp. KOL6]
MRGESRLDRYVIKEILRINRHLPRRRKTLEELLRKERPHVVNRDGTKHYFDRDELERLADVLPRYLHGRLKLPILIELGYSGAAVIRGKAEVRVVCEVLGEEWRFSQDRVELNMFEVRKLRREFPTATQYMFSSEHIMGRPKVERRR